MTGTEVSTAPGPPVPHESAILHVTGAAVFVDDVPAFEGTLHAAPVLSPVAHGVLRGIDTGTARQLPGVRAVVTADDVPGERLLLSVALDEPVLPSDLVTYAGQVVAVVVADSPAQARRGAAAVRLDIEPLPALLSIADARAARSVVMPPVRAGCGDPVAALARAPHVLRGHLSTPPQEHYYLETQVAYAVPQEQGGWLVLCASQQLQAVQAQVASALGVHDNDVRVVCRRVGGGFGGKETQAGNVAVLAAVAAHVVGAPVKMRLRRSEDFLVTGKRHAFQHEYEVGFDDDGWITGLRLVMLADCGHSADVSAAVAERALFHVDNSYCLPHTAVEVVTCRTNRSSATAFRGFGAPQAILLIETLVGDIARVLRIDPLDVRRRNFYDRPDNATGRDTTYYGMRVEHNIGPELTERLALSADYQRRREEIRGWNASSGTRKRWIALVPVKFGISFSATHLNQAGAVVDVLLDATVNVSHGGIELGQGLHTKVLQIVAAELGVPLDHVRIVASDTAIVPNATATAASCTADLNGRAALVAARTVRSRLATLVSGEDGCSPDEVTFHDGLVSTPTRTRTFSDVVTAAYHARVQLWADGFYATPKVWHDPATMSGRPFYYFTFGAACAEVELDTTTGEHRILAVDVLQDVGRSLNPAIDVGQVVGGLVQGIGWLTTEELRWGPDGELLTRGASTYKIPTAHDLPERLTVSLWPDPNPEDTVGHSKAVGEPPFVLAISVLEALRDAVAAIAPDQPVPVRLDLPASPERLLDAVRVREALRGAVPARSSR